MLWKPLIYYSLVRTIKIRIHLNESTGTFIFSSEWRTDICVCNRWWAASGVLKIDCCCSLDRKSFVAAYFDRLNFAMEILLEKPQWTQSKCAPSPDTWFSGNPNWSYTFSDVHKSRESQFFLGSFSYFLEKQGAFITNGCLVIRILKVPLGAFPVSPDHIARAKRQSRLCL